MLIRALNTVLALPSGLRDHWETKAISTPIVSPQEELQDNDNVYQMVKNMVGSRRNISKFRNTRRMYFSCPQLAGERRNFDEVVEIRYRTL